jgi:hypothetical protein
MELDLKSMEMPRPGQPSRLRQVLHSRNAGLAQEADSLIARVAPLLGHTIGTFPSGTSHTPDHTNTVEWIASAIMSNELAEQLRDDELQLLILACHFHDLGMAGTESDNQNATSRDLARRDHAIRIGNRLRDDWQTLGFNDHVRADVLAEICRGHRPTRLSGRASWDDIADTRRLGPGNSVRPRLISAIIFAADELHIGADRAPTREEDWLELKNDEARRHWLWHRTVVGPDVQSDGSLVFDVKPITPAHENSLRKHVLLKALSAIRDANVQLASEGIDAQLAKVEIKWLREEVWKLLILKVLSDYQPRTQQSIVREIKARYDIELSRFESLEDLCVDKSSSESLLTDSITRLVRDLQAGDHLVAQNSSTDLLLNPSTRSSDVFFKTSRHADEVDALLVGRLASDHEFDLLRSAYGKDYAVQSVLSIVENSFGVKLTNQSESAVLACLRSSPTAFRLLQAHAPPQTVLVKRHSLRLAALAGVTLDLFRSPELLLDKQLRESVRILAEEIHEGQSDFLGFVEELALIGAYTPEHMQRAAIHSDAKLRESTGSSVAGNDDIQLHISQTLPAALVRTPASFQHLILASLRSGVKIELLNAAETPMNFQVKAAPELGLPVDDPVSIAIQPSRPRPVARLNLRASLETSPDFDAIEFRLHRLSESNSHLLPVVVGLPNYPWQPDQSVEMQVHFYLPAMTLQQLRNLYELAKRPVGGEVELSLVFADSGRQVAKFQHDPQVVDGFLPRPLAEDLVAALCDVAPEAPLPLGLTDDQIDALFTASAVELKEIYSAYAAQSLDEKQVIPSITIRMVADQGGDYREEYLGLFPEVKFASELSPSSQATVPPKSESIEQPGRISALFSEDPEGLAQQVRDWSEDLASPFPLCFSFGPPDSPVIKSYCEVTILPRIDRVWYAEKPLMIRLRSPKPIERWRREAEYWESIGDHSRAELLIERIQALDNI